MAKKPFEQLAAEAPKEGEGVDIGPDSNMAALMGMADEILAKPLPGEDAPAGPPDDEPAAEEPAAADEPPAAQDMAGGTDLSPIEAMIKENNPDIADADAAQQAEDLWNAAGQRNDLVSLTPEELTTQLKEDSGLLMELKKLAAQGEMAGEGMMPPMAEAAAPPAGAPPMGGPGGMMPPGM